MQIIYLFILSYLIFLLGPFIGFFHAIMHGMLLVEARRSLSNFNSLEHSQQWRQNFSYLTTPKVTLSILPTPMLQQWIYFNFQYNKIIYTSQ